MLTLDETENTIAAGKAKKPTNLKSKNGAPKMPTKTKEEIAEAKKVEKAAKAEAAALLKAEKAEAAKAKETAPAAVKAERIIQNDVTLPLEGSKARIIWDLATSISTELGETVSLNTLIEKSVLAGHSGSTAFGEYSKWRKFHGISGRVVDEATKAANIAKAQAAAEAKAARDAARAARVEQNGVKRPVAGTKAGDIWAILDSLSAQKGEPVPFKEVSEFIKDKDINLNSASGEYSLWRKFNGISIVRAVKVLDATAIQAELDKVIAQQGKLHDKRVKLESDLAKLSSTTEVEADETEDAISA